MQRLRDEEQRRDAEDPLRRWHRHKAAKAARAEARQSRA